MRAATAADAAQMAAIYRPFVEQTCVSFELEAPGADELAARVASAQRQHAWLVAVDADGDVLGYAYGSPHRARAAYRYSTEVSAYVHESSRGRGVGRALYLRLFDELAARGYCNALAGVTMPNDPSVAFHEALGFTGVGVYRRVGLKFGEWRDVAWFERRLRERPLDA